VDLKCSPLSNSQNRGHHLQAHLECLQHHLKTIQSFSRPLPPQLLMDNFLAHLEDPPLAFQRNDSSQLWIRAGRMLQGLRTCPHYQRFLMTNSMPSAINISIRAEWLRQSGRAPSEPSETPRWQTTPRPAPIRHVSLNIALRSRFLRFFSLCRYPIVNEHCGVVANCDNTSV